MAVEVGVVLPGRYQEARLLASGGLGDVYRAVDVPLDRPVAVKILAERFAAEEEIRKRFTRAALLAAQLSLEPHVVPIYDVGEVDDRPFIVMQYLPGGSLADVLAREGAQPAAQVLRWLGDAAQALERAHERGVVHGDLKPANMLLDEQRRVRVSDFALATAVGLAAPGEGEAHLGAASYRAPEQVQGREADAHTDDWALAIVAYELLTGRHPFERRESFETAHHVGIPPAADDVFARALAPARSQRFDSCSQFVAALRAALVGRPGATPVRPAVTYVTPPAVIAASRRRRQRLLPLIGLVVLAIGGLGAAIVATRESSHHTANPPIRVTVTAAGTTVRETITAQPVATPAAKTTFTVTETLALPPTTAPRAATTAPAAVSTAPVPATTAPANPPIPGASGTALAQEGYQRLESGDAVGAVPLLQEAADKLAGTHTLAEAYNDYNLASALAKTTGCSQRVLGLLDESESIQGHRTEITQLRQTCTHHS